MKSKKTIDNKRIDLHHSFKWIWSWLSYLLFQIMQKKNLKNEGNQVKLYKNYGCIENKQAVYYKWIDFFFSCKWIKVYE